MSEIYSWQSRNARDALASRGARDSQRQRGARPPGRIRKTAKGVAAVGIGGVLAVTPLVLGDSAQAAPGPTVANTCGGDYRVVQMLQVPATNGAPGVKVYLTRNAQNYCVVSIKDSQRGRATWTNATLTVQGATGMKDAGYYPNHAGPLYTSRARCVKFSGTNGQVLRGTTAWHCESAGVPRKTPEQACGSGYGRVTSRAITGGSIRWGTAYLMRKGSAYCVATMKERNVGTVSHRVGAYVMGKNGTGGYVSARDYGMYPNYANTTTERAVIANRCIRWAGSIGGASTGDMAYGSQGGCPQP